MGLQEIFKLCQHDTRPDKCSVCLNAEIHSLREERDRVNERLQESQELCMEGAEQLEVAAAKIDGYATEFEKGALEIRKAQEVNGILHFELRTALAEKGELENDWEEPMAERLERADKWIQTRLEEAVKMRKAYGVRTDLDPDDIGGYLLPGPDGAEWKALLESVKEEGHVVRNPGLIAGPVESTCGTEETLPSVPFASPEFLEQIEKAEKDILDGSGNDGREPIGLLNSPEEEGVEMSWCEPCGSYHAKGNCLTETVERLTRIEAMNQGAKFIEHIRAHLKEGEPVICKICEKTVDEIALEGAPSTTELLTIPRVEVISEEECYPHKRCPDCEGKGGRNCEALGEGDSWIECSRCKGRGILPDEEEPEEEREEDWTGSGEMGASG